MSTITINNKNKTLEMTKKFAAAAKRFGTEEYTQLQSARKDYPTYREITVTRHRKPAIGMPRSTYHDQFRKLLSMGNAMGGNQYEFFERPRVVMYIPENDAMKTEEETISAQRGTGCGTRQRTGKGNGRTEARRPYAGTVHAGRHAGRMRRGRSC